MKQYILLVTLLFGALVAPAQDLGVRDNPRLSVNILHQLYHKITRYVANQEKLPWVLAIQHQTTKAIPLRFTGIKWDFISVQPQPPLPQQLSAYTFVWQQQLHKHTLLHNFTVKILNPRDMKDFSPRQAEVLTRFLQNGITAGTADSRYVPVKAEEFKHYLVRLMFQPGGAEKRFYVTANCYTRELFVSLQPQLPGVVLEPLSAARYQHR